jgi:hypothetical protein
MITTTGTPMPRPEAGGRGYRLFDPGNHARSRDHARLYARFEIAYTVVDVAAALCFIVGSVMFFSEAWTRPGTWLFLIGSICFALKPCLRLARELGYWRLGRVDVLAERLDE